MKKSPNNALAGGVATLPKGDYYPSLAGPISVPDIVEMFHGPSTFKSRVILSSSNASIFPIRLS
jgi:hypothetical protein